MRYYIFTALILMLVLCSCGSLNDKTDESSSVLSTEPITVETSVTTCMTTTSETKSTRSQTTTAAGSDAPKTFPVPNGADGLEVIKHYSFKVQSDGVWVYYDDIKGQFLSADCSWSDSNTDPNIQHLNYWRKDFDFDGFYDLFIPEGKAVFSEQGHYFRFVPETGLFIIWDEMNKLGMWANTQNYPDETIFTTVNDENNNGDQKFYIWDDEKLVLNKREHHYLVEENEEGHCYEYDYYTYENGYEQLYRRQRVYYHNGSEWPYFDEDLPLE